MMILPKSLPPSYFRLTKILTLWCSKQSQRSFILTSQFHLQGAKHFQKSKKMVKNASNIIYQIDKLVTELQKNRLKVLQVKQKQIIKDEKELLGWPQCSKYFQTYLKLLQRMKDIKINQEWCYRTVGWYNLQPFHNNLIDELLQTNTKSTHLSLIESIGWMNPNILTFYEQNSYQDFMKIQMKIDHFYRQLNLDLDIKTVRIIQSIFDAVLTQGKSKFFQNYVRINSDSYLSLFSAYSLQDMIWLFEMYTSNMNDQPQVLQKFQDFFISRLQIPHKNQYITKLMKIYQMTGRLNPTLYQKHIKQFIRSSPQNIIQIQIANLQFYISSQCNDQSTLNTILKNIGKIAKKQPISDGQRLHIHYLLHYMEIKDIKYIFPPNIIRQFTQLCKNFKEDGSLAKVMAMELDEKGRHQGIDYYNSNCVLRKRQYEDIKAIEGVEIKDMEGIKKYVNVKFCCLNIEYCIFDEKNKKATILQKSYHRFTHSGRLVRMEEIRDCILRHYGFNVNYLETKSQQSKKTGIK